MVYDECSILAYACQEPRMGRVQPRQTDEVETRQSGNAASLQGIPVLVEDRNNYPVEVGSIARCPNDRRDAGLVWLELEHWCRGCLQDSFVIVSMLAWQAPPHLGDERIDVTGRTTVHFASSM